MQWLGCGIVVALLGYRGFREGREVVLEHEAKAARAKLEKAEVPKRVVESANIPGTPNTESS